MTEEVKKRGRKKRSGIDKSSIVEVFISGKEKDAFSFFNAIKDAFRKKGLYTSYEKILREITKEDIWKDVDKIKEVLSKYSKVIIR